MRISDWSSDVCSSDLSAKAPWAASIALRQSPTVALATDAITCSVAGFSTSKRASSDAFCHRPPIQRSVLTPSSNVPDRSEEHTSELQSLMRISYAVFCLKKKKQKRNILKTYL